MLIPLCQTLAKESSLSQIMALKNQFDFRRKVHLQPFTKYLRLTLVSMWNSALH